MAAQRDDLSWEGTFFDLTNGKEGTPPAGERIVVVTHRPRPEGWHPEAVRLVVENGQLSRIYAVKNPRKLTRLDRPAELARSTADLYVPIALD